MPPDLPARTERALAEIEAIIERAWAEFAAAHPGEWELALAQTVFAAPDEHEWPLVDAALDRIECDECGSRLGSGPRGCPECDFADGYRFAAREVDRPGVPPGNEHAVRVSSAVLRAPHRWPEPAVLGNQLFLPLFLEGQMPTRAEQERFEAAVKRGLPSGIDLSSARTFAELVALAAGR